jgi:hypothetical protein
MQIGAHPIEQAIRSDGWIVPLYLFQEAYRIHPIFSGPLRHPFNTDFFQLKDHFPVQRIDGNQNPVLAAGSVRQEVPTGSNGNLSFGNLSGFAYDYDQRKKIPEHLVPTDLPVPGHSHSRGGTDTCPFIHRIYQQRIIGYNSHNHASYSRECKHTTSWFPASGHSISEQKQIGGQWICSYKIM